MKSSAMLVRQARLMDSRDATTQEAASRIARLLLDESAVADGVVCEASVHRGKRRRIWVASFTGPAGQVWRSTGLANRTQALLLARRWEKEARAHRSAAGLTARNPLLRVRHRESGKSTEPLSQREIATLLGISVRAVRLIERRAFQKLFNHPSLRQIWRRYLAGELDEHESKLTPEEISAVFNLARNAQEWLVLEKVTRLIRG